MVVPAGSRAAAAAGCRPPVTKSSRVPPDGRGRAECGAQPACPAPAPQAAGLQPICEGTGLPRWSPRSGPTICAMKSVPWGCAEPRALHGKARARPQDFAQVSFGHSEPGRSPRGPCSTPSPACPEEAARAPARAGEPGGRGAGGRAEPCSRCWSLRVPQSRHRDGDRLRGQVMGTPAHTCHIDRHKCCS